MYFFLVKRRKRESSFLSLSLRILFFSLLLNKLYESKEKAHSPRNEKRAPAEDESTTNETHRRSTIAANDVVRERRCRQQRPRQQQRGANHRRARVRDPRTAPVSSPGEQLLSLGDPAEDAARFFFRGSLCGGREEEEEEQEGKTRRRVASADACDAEGRGAVGREGAPRHHPGGSPGLGSEELQGTDKAQARRFTFGLI